MSTKTHGGGVPETKLRQAERLAPDLVAEIRADERSKVEGERQEIRKLAGALHHESDVQVVRDLRDKREACLEQYQEVVERAKDERTRREFADQGFAEQKERADKAEQALATERSKVVGEVRNVWVRVMADPGAVVPREQAEGAWEDLIEWQLRALLASLNQEAPDER